MSALTRVLAVALCLVVTTPGCATLLNGKKKTIFLHMSEETARSTTFYLDGKPVDWQMQEYSSREVGRSGDTVTVEVTYLPALVVESPPAYVSVAAQLADGTRSEILIKRELMRGYKLYVYLNFYLTFGVGNLVDFMGSGLFGMTMGELAVGAPTAPLAMTTTRTEELP